ncbi:hypothetical protein SJAG_06595 [Schizosaccharomyces japonicus yFS275]|uniref:Uncharacterized protein n=1 Tax=Schizosaccharomyces japonicus (strain yFS275 / FY16936) TaxID=402676 RepID=T0T6L6_SCHJY|nr:hypothetical protein SJAG_06595 [Schizosaccharomyces japonicus yFS275]EQC53069.1 hypothetical protein SJAG_06595 [Schizosaccharomyces japonicus yFS275]
MMTICIIATIHYSVSNICECGNKLFCCVLSGALSKSNAVFGIPLWLLLLSSDKLVFFFCFLFPVSVTEQRKNKDLSASGVRNVTVNGQLCSCHNRRYNRTVVKSELLFEHWFCRT